MEDIIEYKGEEIKRLEIPEYYSILREHEDGSSCGSSNTTLGALSDVIQKAIDEFGRDAEAEIEFMGYPEDDHEDASSSFEIFVVKRRLQTDEEFQNHITAQKERIDKRIEREILREEERKADRIRKIQEAKKLLMEEGLL